MGFRVFSSSSTAWFSSLVPTDHVSNVQRIIPIAKSEIPLDDSVAAAEVDGKVKTKLLSMWNNVKYGWTVKMKTNFSKEYPVWLLGSCYHKKPIESLEKASEAVDVETGSEISLAIDAANFEEGIDGFKRDFLSRLWLTYRREFPILNGSSFTSDCGWGCMLRSGQMMLAQALVCHFLSRDWRWHPEQRMETAAEMEEDEKHRMIIKCFGDQAGPHSPFSIHTLVSLGASAGKRAGDWYGPASVAHILSHAVKLAATSHNEFKNLTAYVAQDCAVYLDDVRRLCETSEGKWKSLILLVPLRLGTDKLNPSYAPCLTALLSLESCIGIIGGRPRHSLYFIGYQEDKLIHLDPHFCQETVDMWKPDFSLSTFHCTSPRKMLVSKMDPSCCVGFYLHDKSAFENFVKIVEPFLVPMNQKTDYPMFLFCDGSGDDLRRKLDMDKNHLSSSIAAIDREKIEDSTYHECEEFEIL
ncbi:cysteine protease ATG4D isoform X2 [Belonocnema kinseyi]|uniref:cysteine protease ATG4D isoform X2 n=1 Tax=Belonocnema kinseyi TaxID=2817044 RepID=UPI00143DA808|nr:cysteine protease ATG4D isoform X2 [Belonocnema kinseyi]